MVFFGAIAVILVLLLASQPAARREQVAAAPTTTPEVTVEATSEAAVEATAEPTGAVTWNLDPQAVAAGETAFSTVCTACHGFTGQGIQGLGKSLVGTDFINSQSDEELAAFIIKGRDISDPLNTTGVMMPARGGNPALGDQDVVHIVAYIRSLNVAAGFEPGSGSAASVPAGDSVQPTAAPSEPTAAAPAPVVPEVVGGITPEIGQGELNLSSLDSEQAYLWACAACHGVDGSPVAPLATIPLADSQLVQAQDDDGLLAFLAPAQPPVNPLEAFPHPYRGGYPQLTDEQLRGVIVHMYTLVEPQ